MRPHPQNAVLRSGEILVAERTDPGWIMLFAAASGLLVERGSLLSHSAIVSREMGIPGIVGLAGVTGWLTDGEWVELDGTSGTVRKIAPDEPPRIRRSGAEGRGDTGGKESHPEALPSGKDRVAGCSKSSWKRGNDTLLHVCFKKRECRRYSDEGSRCDPESWQNCAFIQFRGRYTGNCSGKGTRCDGRSNPVI
ncbi:MAG: PEP-utilizing enzyme [Capsulimonadaceae bacterium]